MKLLVIIGAIEFPVFTLGLVVGHYDHPILAGMLIIISFIKGHKSDSKPKS